MIFIANHWSDNITCYVNSKCTGYSLVITGVTNELITFNKIQHVNTI